MDALRNWLNNLSDQAVLVLTVVIACVGAVFLVYKLLCALKCFHNKDMKGAGKELAFGIAIFILCAGGPTALVFIAKLFTPPGSVLPTGGEGIRIK